MDNDHTGWEQSRRALDEIQELSAEHGAQFLVVIFPFFHDLDGEYPFQIVHDAVRGYCESVGIPVLDLRDRYREYNGSELWMHETDQPPKRDRAQHRSTRHSGLFERASAVDGSRSAHSS